MYRSQRKETVAKEEKAYFISIMRVFLKDVKELLIRYIWRIWVARFVVEKLDLLEQLG